MPPLQYPPHTHRRTFLIIVDPGKKEALQKVTRVGGSRVESQVTQRGQPRSSRVRQGQYNQRTDYLTRASQIDTVDMLKAFVFTL